MLYSYYQEQLGDLISKNAIDQANLNRLINQGAYNVYDFNYYTEVLRDRTEIRIPALKAKFKKHISNSIWQQRANFSGFDLALQGGIRESKREVGMEFEFAGITYYQAESVIEDGWEVDSDCSIPVVKESGDYCNCRIGLFCDQCEEDRNNCCCEPDCTCRNCECLEDCSCLEDCECEYDFYGNSTEYECTCEDIGGAEIISPPGFGDEFFSEVQSVFESAVDCAESESREWRIKDSNSSRATGYHVHVNPSDMSVEQRAAFIIILNQFLEEMSQEHPSILPYWRITNFYYCKQYNLSFSELLSVAYERFEKESSNCRYKTVNVSQPEGNKPLTLEVRIGFLPVSGKAAVKWAQWLQCLADRISELDLTGHTVSSFLSQVTV